MARDTTNDLALLKTSGMSASVAGLRISVRLGEPVAAFGFPLAALLSSAGNFTRGDVTALSGLGDDTRFFQISVPVQPGNSGGPLLDARGNLIGIVTGKLNALKVMEATGGDLPQNVNFAIKAPVLTNFLEANQITFRGGANYDLDIAGLSGGGTENERFRQMWQVTHPCIMNLLCQARAGIVISVGSESVRGPLTVKAAARSRSALSASGALPACCQSRERPGLGVKYQAIARARSSNRRSTGRLGFVWLRDLRGIDAGARPCPTIPNQSGSHIIPRDGTVCTKPLRCDVVHAAASKRRRPQKIVERDPSA